jgi:hypothetical protein
MSSGTAKISSNPTPVLGSEVGRVSISGGRATPRGPSFGSVLANARPILRGAEAVATVLPGGPLVSAAIRGSTAMSGSVPGSAMTSYGSARPAGVPTTPRSPSVGPSGATSIGSGSMGPTGAVDGAAGADWQGIESVLADSQAFNLYYLQLQEQVSAENRQYTTVSNVLKARHDTVKNAIGNIR